MNVLCIVMEFAPINRAGVPRAIRLLNGLKMKGINPIVITFEINGNVTKLLSTDERLINSLDPAIQVIRIPLDDVTKLYSTRWKKFKNIYFNVTDNFLKAWKKNLFTEIPEVIKVYKPAAIIATCPPFSTAVLARDISREYKLPLLLEMRDAWAKLSMLPSGSYFHYIYKKSLERSCFRRAAAIVTVTPQLSRIFQETHPDIHPQKFSVVYNSFDFDLTEKFNVRAPLASDTEVIQIGYAGSYYYSPEGEKYLRSKWWQRKSHRMLQYLPVKEDWRYRSPFYFFKALQYLFLSEPKWKSRIKFNHIGKAEPWLIEMIADFGLEENVVLHGYLPYDETIERQQAFHYLLATSEKVLNGEHYCLPSKLFTYVRSGRPILGFVTKGIQADFILKSNTGYVFCPDDFVTAAENMKCIFSTGVDKEVDTNYLHRFSRSNAISEFESIVRNITIK